MSIRGAEKEFQNPTAEKRAEETSVILKTIDKANAERQHATSTVLLALLGLEPKTP